ncbi:uncharacterized protein LOC144862338 isoform X2 [Branchiostoma floridae x Branchiostoma japonicum]
MTDHDDPAFVPIYDTPRSSYSVDDIDSQQAEDSGTFDARFDGANCTMGDWKHAGNENPPPKVYIPPPAYDNTYPEMYRPAGADDDPPPPPVAAHGVTLTIPVNATLSATNDGDTDSTSNRTYISSYGMTDRDYGKRGSALLLRRVAKASLAAGILALLGMACATLILTNQSHLENANVNLLKTQNTLDQLARKMSFSLASLVNLRQKAAGNHGHEHAHEHPHGNPVDHSSPSISPDTDAVEAKILDSLANMVDTKPDVTSATEDYDYLPDDDWPMDDIDDLLDGADSGEVDSSTPEAEHAGALRGPPASCKDIQKTHDGLNNIFPFPGCTTPIQVYCHNMTRSPAEFLPLSHLKTLRMYHMATGHSTIQYEKVRVKFEGRKIVPVLSDLTFATFNKDQALPPCVLIGTCNPGQENTCCTVARADLSFTNPDLRVAGSHGIGPIGRPLSKPKSVPPRSMLFPNTPTLSMSCGGFRRDPTACKDITALPYLEQKCGGQGEGGDPAVDPYPPPLVGLGELDMIQSLLGGI